MAIWVYVTIVFCLVELLEIVRAVQRVRMFGLKNGLFVYSVTQWARNFTFGMFVAFTISLPIQHSSSLQIVLLETVRNTVVSAGSLVVIALFIIQSTLFARHLLRQRKGLRATIEMSN